MKYFEDTIAALCTPVGTGALAVIRISGNSSFDIIEKIFKGKKYKQTGTASAVFGYLYDNNRFLDEVVVTYFKAPKSFTGEDIAEISCHGNSYIVSQILKTVLKHCRQALHGEFTQRAFLNNKIDLTKAEAIGELYKVKTEKSHKLVAKQLEGTLYKFIKKLLNEIIAIRTNIELEIDFVEQGLDSLDENKTLNQMNSLLQKLQKLAGSVNDGLIIKDGLKVILAGKPNVGKSSIFNRFLKTERAIVTPHPGTTRDYIEEAFALNGFLIRLFDTAGLRKADDEVEKIGIERSKEMFKNADVILYVFTDDNEYNLISDLKDEYSKTIVIAVKNKCDNNLNNNNMFIPCSATTKNGLQLLKQKLISILNKHNDEENPMLTNARQQVAVVKCIENFKKAINTLKNNMGYEFVAFDLKEASYYLEEIVGKVTTEDLLTNIFENFCIGK